MQTKAKSKKSGIQEKSTWSRGKAIESWVQGKGDEKLGTRRKDTGPDGKIRKNPHRRRHQQDALRVKGQRQRLFKDTVLKTRSDYNGGEGKIRGITMEDLRRKHTEPIQLETDKAGKKKSGEQVLQE